MTTDQTWLDKPTEPGLWLCEGEPGCTWPLWVCANGSRWVDGHSDGRRWLTADGSAGYGFGVEDPAQGMYEVSDGELKVLRHRLLWRET